MRRNLLNLSSLWIFLFILFSISQNLLCQDFVIRSLRVYSADDQTSFPVIDSRDKAKQEITIEFDLLSNYMPYFNIVFKFCDSNGNPYDSPFFANPLYNTEHSIFFDKTPSNVSGAAYHYTGTFPNANVQFPFSGKWKFYIVDSQNSDKVYSSGQFYVVDPSVPINFSTASEGLQGDMSQAAILQRSIRLNADFTLPDTLYSNNIIKVEIIQNRKFDNPIVIDRIQTTHDRYYEWNASNRFTFIARSIHPGNKYRQVDLRDHNKYGTQTVEAKFGEFDESNLFTEHLRDNFGGSILTEYRNSYADYMNVVFRLRAPESVKDPIYLVGSFTNWQVLPDYEMYDDNGMMNLSVPLKRGVYDYAYVTGKLNGDVVEDVNWEILEGNFFETENEYNVFLYYLSPEKGGYDKIIGFTKIKTGAL
jgi:hypothetical protein